MTIQDFDPHNLIDYMIPPYLLHFQWGSSNEVHRYALVEVMGINDIDQRTKQKVDEVGLSQKEIWEKKYKGKNNGC